MAGYLVETPPLPVTGAVVRSSHQPDKVTDSVVEEAGIGGTAQVLVPSSIRVVDTPPAAVESLKVVPLFIESLKMRR